MKMPDVNILVYAHRGETTNHSRYAEWTINLAKSGENFALSELVASGFVRIVTNPKIFRPASTLSQAFSFLQNLTDLSACILMRPGDQHFGIFQKLCVDCDARGKLAADAYHAALAIEYGCCWITADSDFVRFKSFLDWEHL